MAATGAAGIGIVAGVGQAVIDAQLDAAADDLGFGPADQRGVDGESQPALDARLRGQVGHRGERGDVLRPAVGIAAVVDRVDAEEDVGRADRLGIGQRQRQQHRVPRRHVGDRDAVGHLVGRSILGHVDRGRQGTAAELAPDRPTSTTCRSTPKACGHAPGGLELEAVPLAVVDRQGVQREALAAGRWRRSWPNRAPRIAGSTCRFSHGCIVQWL